MNTDELTNVVIYSSFQTKYLENRWANHASCSWCGVIDYHSFPGGSFVSL